MTNECIFSKSIKSTHKKTSSENKTKKKKMIITLHGVRMTMRPSGDNCYEPRVPSHCSHGSAYLLAFTTPLPAAKVV